MIADEIQSGLARTGRTFACDHWDVVPDIYLLGKALGGGVVPLSAVVADRDILGVLHPGEHGSTFGGNPLAAAIGSTVVSMLRSRRVPGPRDRTRDATARAAAGADRSGRGRRARTRAVGRRRHRPGARHRQAAQPATGRTGMLVKDTHGSTMRFAPPLVITADEIDWAIQQFAETLADWRPSTSAPLCRPGSAPGQCARAVADEPGHHVGHFGGAHEAVRLQRHRPEAVDEVGCLPNISIINSGSIIGVSTE